MPQFDVLRTRGTAIYPLVVDIQADQATATYHLIPSSEIDKDYSKRTPEELQRKFTTHRFRVQNGAITAA